MSRSTRWRIGRASSAGACTSLPLLALGACVGISLAGCGAGNDIDLGPTATAQRQRIERIVVATGTIEPENEVDVRPRIAGIIETLHVEPGDSVEPGQPLVEIERELLSAQVREAEAALKEAEVESHYAGKDHRRMSELQGGGVTSAQDFDTAAARKERAAAAVLRARARLDRLSTQLSYATVRSPIAGRILDVFVEEGSAVSPVTSVTGGTILLSLAGTKTLHLEGLVDENEIARVEVGQHARIRTEAYSGREFEAVVSEIAPLGQRIQNVTYFEVELEIIDPDANLLKPRMSGDAEIIAEVVNDGLVIPETALRYASNRIYVRTVTVDGDDPPEIVEKNVSIGIVDDALVQILSGLEPGEVVQLQ
jgi:HlyD family secretion protein